MQTQMIRSTGGTAVENGEEGMLNEKPPLKRTTRLDVVVHMTNPDIPFDGSMFNLIFSVIASARVYSSK